MASAPTPSAAVGVARPPRDHGLVHRAFGWLVEHRARILAAIAALSIVVGGALYLAGEHAAGDDVWGAAVALLAAELTFEVARTVVVDHHMASTLVHLPCGGRPERAAGDGRPRPAHATVPGLARRWRVGPQCPADRRRARGDRRALPLARARRAFAAARNRAPRQILQTKADDSSGLIGDLARDLLGAHARACDAGVADPVKLAAWIVRFRFRDQDFFEADPVRYREALGEDGLAALRQAVAVEPDRDGFATRWFRERLAVLDGDSEQIVALLGGDLSQPYQYIRLADAMSELGRDDEVLRWCEQGIERTSGWQTAQLYDLVLRRGPCPPRRAARGARAPPLPARALTEQLHLHAAQDGRRQARSLADRARRRPESNSASGTPASSSTRCSPKATSTSPGRPPPPQARQARPAPLGPARRATARPRIPPTRCRSTGARSRTRFIRPTAATTHKPCACLPAPRARPRPPDRTPPSRRDSMRYASSTAAAQP